MRANIVGVLTLLLILGACSGDDIVVGDDSDAGDGDPADIGAQEMDASDGVNNASTTNANTGSDANGGEPIPDDVESDDPDDTGEQEIDTSNGAMDASSTDVEHTESEDANNGGGEDAGDGDAAHPDTGESEDTGEPSDPCEGRTLSSDWLRLTTGPQTCRYGDAMSGSYGIWMQDADCRYFEGVYPWPWDEQQSSQRVMGVQPQLNDGYQYIALEFDSAALPPDDSGQLNVNIPQADPLLSRRKLMTMSTCPGDFNQEAIEAELGPGCYRESFTNNFRWGGTDHTDAIGRCGLEPHTTYYLNIIHTNDELGTPIDELEPNEECLEDGCGFRLTPAGNVY